MVSTGQKHNHFRNCSQLMRKLRSEAPVCQRLHAPKGHCLFVPTSACTIQGSWGTLPGLRSLLALLPDPHSGS